MVGCNTHFDGLKIVHSVTHELPAFHPVDVTNPDKFANDLKLSPLWKVEKNSQGIFEAHARAITPDSASEKMGRMFLFELLSTPGQNPPKNYRINNRYIDGSEDAFSSFSAYIVFQKPTDSYVSFCENDKEVTLGVYDSWEHKLGLNSLSVLAIKISKAHEIYLLIHEQGIDSQRATTFARLPSIMRAIADVVELPSTYRAEEQYRRFYQLFFDYPLKDKELKRLPGIQGRDTFYGYFKVQPQTNYEGVNIRITHPVYCGGECTLGYERLNKAEYLGKPYQDFDFLFFLIEDNAVYLTGNYDKDFGIFSGTNSFDAKLEVLNADGEVLIESVDKFKGWER